MIVDSQIQVLFDDLDITELPYAIAASSGASDTTFGSPTPVTTTIDWQVLDGSWVKHERDDNRELHLYVYITDADTDLMAAAEEALALKLYKPTTLTVTSVDGIGETVVYEVLDSYMGFDFDDVREMNLIWAFPLVLTCMPYVRAENPTVHAALPAGTGSAPVVIADGTSATGWSSPYGAVTISNGMLFAPAPAPTAVYHGTNWDGSTYTTWRCTAAATRTFTTAVDLRATPYVSLDVSSPAIVGPYIDSFQLSVNGGTPNATISSGRIDSTSWVSRYTFYANLNNVTTLTFGMTRYFNVPDDQSPPTSLAFDNVLRSVSPATAGAQIRTIEVDGSMRSPGSLQIGSPTKSLGPSIVYTCPALAAGYNPNLYADSSTDLVTVPVACSPVPLVTLPPGSYVLMGAVQPQTTPDGVHDSGLVSFSWSAQTLVNGSAVGAVTRGTASTDAWNQAKHGPGTNASLIVALGAMTLPPTGVRDNSNAALSLTIGAPVQTAYSNGALVNNKVALTNAWIFWRGDDAALSIFNLPQTGGSRNIWLDSADISHPQPSAWVGSASDGSDAWHAGSIALPFEQHIFTPPTTQAFIYTQNANDTQVTFAHYARGHSHLKKTS